MEERKMEIFHQLKSDALRTFLSLAGVSVGIFVVTVSFSLVDAFQRAVVAGFDHFGSDMIMVEQFPVVAQESSGTEEDDWSRYAARPMPSLDDYLALEGSAGWVAFAGQSSADAQYGGKILREAKLLGVCGAWQHMVYSSVCAGRDFSLAELSGGDAKVILGAKAARALTGIDNDTDDLCGQSVRIGGRNMTVIGILSEEGKNVINLYATDYALVVPFSAAEDIAGKQKPETMIAIGPSGGGRDVTLAESRRLLRASRRLRSYQEDNFALNTMEDLCRETVSLTSRISIIGIVIALFSLLIGGFGIVNIMLVSVKERTFSIGLKMALGAQRRRILLEFIAEALLLSFLGAALGLLLASLAVSIIPKGVIEAQVSQKHILYGFAIALVLGLISGVAPAAKASRLNPADALRG